MTNSFLDFVINIATVSSIFISIGVLIVGLFLAIAGFLTVGEVFALSFISSGISNPMSELSNSIPQVKASKALYTKVEDNILSLTNSTTIAVTHRLDERIFRKYDQIMIIHNSTINAVNTYDILIEENLYFKELVRKQKVGMDINS